MDEDQNMALLPEDIVFEILLRLSVKPLFKFKCVSKQCRSIISGPKFAQEYLRRAYSSPESSSSSGLVVSLLFPFTYLYRKYLSNDLTHRGEQDRQLPIFITSVSVPNDENHMILASSNGLMLSIYHHKYILLRAFVLHVSNPLTKQCVPIPKSTPIDSDELLFGIATRLSCSYSTFLTYKVVAVRYVKKDVGPRGYANTSVEIFCSVTGSWVALEVRCRPGEIMDSRIAKGALTYQGALHWLSRRTRTVITYDPYNSPHRFGHIRLPNQNHPCRGGSLVHSGDEEVLKYCEIDKGDGVDRVSVWRLARKGEWCVEGRFSIPSLEHSCWKVMVAPYPWNRHIICHPYVRHNKLTVINPWSGRREFVNVFEGTKRPVVDLFSLRDWKCSYSYPMISIQLCPWSSPYYAQAD